MIGAAETDRPERATEPLFPVADELGLVAGAAVDPRPAIAGTGGEELPEEGRADVEHAVPGGELQGAEPFGPRRKARGRELGEAP